MKKLKVKQILDRLGKFVLDKWEWILGIGSLIAFGVYFSMRAGNLKEAAKQFQVLNQKRRNDHKKAVEKRAKELQERQRVIDKTAKAMKEIEQRFTRKEQELKKKVKKEVQNIAEENEKNPEEFARKIADKYGLEYVEEGDDGS